MEKKYHELTQMAQRALSYEKMDSIIRKWLEEKAVELSSKPHSHFYAKQILGLTDEVNDDLGDLVKPQKQSWCEHMDAFENGFRKGENTLIPKLYTLFGHQIEFCPICGTPRPTPKPLVERLAEVNHAAWMKSMGEGERWGEVDPEMRSHWIDEAQSALDFLREHKEEL